MVECPVPQYWVVDPSAASFRVQLGRDGVTPVLADNAVEDGIRIYRQDPGLYYRMLAEGIGHIQRTFSWQRAGQEYARKVG